MDDSILTSVKKILGITEEYEYFDQDIAMHINSVLMILTQMGVGSSTGFSILDKSATWTDFIGDATNLEAVKTYVALKVRLMFDPPSGSVTESINRTLSELEWRIFITVDQSK